jgi:hypothetical protein
MLTDPQIERYARHVLLREVGGVGQERLLGSRVAVVGLGPAGAWATAYLALAGLGRIDLVDGRPVGPDDLVPLLDPGDLGRPRDEALAAAVAAYNPDVSARSFRFLAAREGPAPESGLAEAGAPAPVVADPPDASVRGSGILAAEARPSAENGPAEAGLPALVVVTEPELAGGFGIGADLPAVAAFAAGDGSIAGLLEPAGPCPACLARMLGGAAAPSPAAALLAGSLAATAVLTRIAAGAVPEPGFFLGQAGALRHLEPAAIPCPHRR